jgi:multidrug efflux pump subunit AcrB
MNPIVFALRRPLTIMVLVVAVALGSGLAVYRMPIDIFPLLLLTADFQSVNLALVVVSTTPAVVAGVILMLWLTGTTVNPQSFMGSIITIGVAVANPILLVAFAEQHRREEGAEANRAAIEGARGRLRPILMTRCAMIAGMVPSRPVRGPARRGHAGIRPDRGPLRRRHYSAQRRHRAPDQARFGCPPAVRRGPV